MLADVLIFLRAHLDEQIRLAFGGSQDDASGERVVFVDGDKSEPLSLQQNAVTMLLLNLEEERLLRGSDRRLRAGSGRPPLRLMLDLLFVARFKRYDEAWRHLAQIVDYLHTQPVLDAEVAPALPAGLERVVFELRTLELSQMNVIWSSLRIAHHPSLLYRAKLVAFAAKDERDAPVIDDLVLAAAERL